jgi:density-regulated protein DRP1
LTAFYQEYVPEKVETVPSLLEKYAGKEEKLFEALTKKYGPEPKDPYYSESSEEEEEESDEEAAGEKAAKRAASDRKRRGASAKKKTGGTNTRVVVQKQAQKKKRVLTVVTGLDTVEGVKLKDASKIFSKKFAGSSSVKDKDIIVQGDHVFELAELIVDKFGVPEDAVFLDIDGEVVPLR